MSTTTRHDDENSDPGKEPDREKSAGNRTNGVELSAFRIQPDQGELCGWHRSPCYDQSLSTNAWPHAIFQTITGNHRICQLRRVVSNNKQNLSTFLRLYIIRVVNCSFPMLIFICRSTITRIWKFAYRANNHEMIPPLESIAAISFVATLFFFTPMTNFLERWSLEITPIRYERSCFFTFRLWYTFVIMI